jgi:hypothetical protein
MTIMEPQHWDVNFPASPTPGQPVKVVIELSKNYDLIDPPTYFSNGLSNGKRQEYAVFRVVKNGGNASGVVSHTPTLRWEYTSSNPDEGNGFVLLMEKDSGRRKPNPPKRTRGRVTDPGAGGIGQGKSS